MPSIGLMKEISMVRRQIVVGFLLAFLVLVTLLRSLGQQPLSGFEDGNVTSRYHPTSLPATTKPTGEFRFVRIIYPSPHSPYNQWFGGAWRVDYPEAVENLTEGIYDWASSNLRLSRPLQIRPTDQRLFDYPFAYIVEPGHMELTDTDAAALREYLMRGGFLMLDDFHGEYEWQHAREQVRKILPEYEIKDLPLTHPIFHSYFDVDQVVQVPGVAALIHGVTYEKGGVTPHYMGVENKDGRLMVFLTRNCDLGDAWEWINDPRYPARFGLMAYKIGMNVIVYAMSH